MSTKELQQKRLYARAVREWVEQEGGCFLVLSDDSMFVNILRTAAYKHLGLRAGCVRSFSRSDNMLKAIKETIKSRQIPFLFIETDTDGQTNVEFLKFLRANLPDIFVLVMTTEAIREKLVLFIEEGASGYLIKPVSVDSLLEKVAKLVKPASKIASFVRRGNRMMFLKQYEKALRIANKILEVKADSASALILKGDALKCLGKREQALSAYRQANDCAGMFLDPLKRLAEHYKEEGDEIRELGYLDQLDELSPWNIDRKLSIGTINVKLGNLERAEEVFDEVVKLTNREAKARVSSVSRKIGDMFSKRDAALAEKYLAKSLIYKRNSLSKADVETFNALGMALRQQGKWKDAVTNYMTALKLAPTEPNLHYNLALAFTEGGEHKKAVEHLDMSLKYEETLGQDSSQVSFNIGYVFAQGQRYQDAIKYLTLSAGQNPGNPKTAALLKAVKAKAAQHQEAAVAESQKDGGKDKYKLGI